MKSTCNYKQPICFLSAECPNAVDLAIILDSSLQVGSESNFNSLKQFVQDIVDSFTVATDVARIALISFSDTASIEWDLNDFTSAAQLSQQIDNLDLDSTSNSNIAQGIQVTHEDLFTAGRGDRANVPNVAVLIAASRATIR